MTRVTDTGGRIVRYPISERTKDSDMAEDEGLLPSDTVRIQVGEDAALSDDAAAALNDLAQALAAQAEGSGAEVEGFSAELFGMMMSGGKGMMIMVKVTGSPGETGGISVRKCAVDVSVTLPAPKKQGF